MKTRIQLLIVASSLLTVEPLHAQLVPDGATNTLSNITNTISGGVTVGTNGSLTLLTLSDNVLLTNSSQGVIGLNATARSNEVRLISASARWHMGGSLLLGLNGAANRLTVSNGGFVRANVGDVGILATSSNNVAMVTGAGSLWSNALELVIGFGSAGNQLVISNGGVVRNTVGYVGNDAASSNNLAVVTDPGSLWTNGAVLYVGFNGGSGNQLRVDNGGRVVNSDGFLGFGATSRSNTALVTGTGTIWSNRNNLIVGNNGSGNVLIVSNGATIMANNVFVGLNTAATNNRVVVDGGTFRVTNAAGTSVLDVRRGTNVLNAGFVEVDRLLVTNSQGRFVVNGGTLSSKNTIATNGQAFTIGNDVGAATFLLAGNGTHTFTGLTVDNLGTLTGNGTVGLPVPNIVVVLDGGTVSPGSSIGTIGFTSPLLVFGTTLMEISRNGAVLTNDQIQISAGLTHNGKLTVTNLGPTPLAAGDRFPLFSAPFAPDSLASLTLPPLGPGLSWTNKFLVDGSIEVLGLIVQTLPASGLASNTATLNGVVSPGGHNTTAWIEYGFTTNYGNTTAPQALGSGNAPVSINEVLTDLSGGVTYHFRAVASNSFGAVFGSDQSFMLPTFADIGAGLPGIEASSVAWGDYDNDGRLDILLTGESNTEFFSQVWRNTGSGFTNINAGLPAVASSSVAWGDYDNDGRLDILLTGYNTGTNQPAYQISQVWRNTGSGFTNINAGLPGVLYSSVAWGDYDNDGRLDILLTGLSSNESITQVWRNTGGGFTDIGAGLPAVQRSSVAWGDYDNDGRLDILLTGESNTEFFSQVWRNTGSGFTNINAGLPAVASSSVAWGDYDNDGRLDILLTGLSTNEYITQVWRNTDSGFTNINAGLPGVFRGAAAWGDYDNDGRLDILLTGTTNENALGGLAQVWRNTGNGFTNINAELLGVSRSSVAWGDYDNDGRLDILIAGVDTTVERITQVWRNNNTPITNTAPSAPSGLNVTLFGQTATFIWNSASDAQTSASGLSYNLRVGTTPGGEVVDPMAASSGMRHLPELGNAQMVTFRTINNVPAGQPLYWSVQAIDTAFAGGPFAPEKSFTFNSVFTPTNGIPVPGDKDGDGIVSQSELAAVLTNLNGNGVLTEVDLNLVLSNYFPNSPFLQITNVAGLGGMNVTFALSNSLAGDFSVEYTTNLADWYLLGPATPRYLFTDTNAPAVPQRHYRLRWP